MRHATSSLLETTGVPCRSYQGIDGTTCPLENDGAESYAVRHNPVLYFDDVTNGNDPHSARLGLLTCEDSTGMIVVSTLAKGHGCKSGIAYDHSSALRTFQEIFGVGPLLRGAANATDLRDPFVSFP